MYLGKKVVVVMPAYNAVKTLRRTHDEVIEQGVVDLVIVVDDGSGDETVSVARQLPKTQVIVHARNLGYGGGGRGTWILVRLARWNVVKARLLPANLRMPGGPRRA